MAIHFFLKETKTKDVQYDVGWVIMTVSETIQHRDVELIVVVSEMEVPLDRKEKEVVERSS